MDVLDLKDSEDVHGLHGRVKFKKAHQVTGEAGAWMDMERKKLQAYEYLCHVGEAKEWIEAVIKEQVPPIQDLEESLRNGITLAKLSKAFDPTLANRKIFTDTSRLQFRHSDNINMLFTAMNHIRLPDLFVFELTDLYDKKNIPKVIYCIHALGHLLYKLGMAPPIKNLLGQLSFTDEQLDATNESLEAAAVPMPSFANVKTALAKELDEPSEEEKRWAYLKQHEDKIKKIQSTWRSYRDKKATQDRENVLKSHEELWTKLQARYRGKKDRSKYLDKVKKWRNSEQSIAKLQALWKAKQAEKAYKALCSGQNVGMKVLQNFLFLLEDGDYDFEDDIELEQLRQKVIMRIRENITSETDVGNLDTKIALLVKNRITLEEVVHFTTKQMKSKLQSSTESINEKEGDSSFNLKGADKENRQRKVYYEQLFYLLQTQPHYLSKLMYLMNQKSGASVGRFLEQTVLTLYGYAQNSREEYLLLNLIDSAIKLEISSLTKIEDFWRDNPLFIKLVLQYIRGAKERLFLRELLQSLIKKVLKSKSLDLELDPINIYKNVIKQEESSSGQKSQKSYDVSASVALSDPAVQEIQNKNFASLKKISEDFLSSILISSKNMPYGIRYIALRLKVHLEKKFPQNLDEIDKIIGHLIYYRYVNPAIIAPEAFDVIESNISPSQRKNLADIAKTLHQISTGKITTEHIGLKSYIESGFTRFSAFLKQVENVVPADEYFNMNEFLDSGNKPKIYISPEEVYQVHRNLDVYIEELTNESDPLRVILKDLGAVPPAGYGSKQAGSEIVLELKNRFAKLQEQDKTSNKLLRETKKLVIAVIHVQTGNSLLEALEAPVTSKEEVSFSEYVQVELDRAAERLESEKAANLDNSNASLSPLSIDSPTSLESLHLGYKINSLFISADGSKMTFAQLKRKTLESMDKLEEYGLASKKNKYQDMLNLLTEDVLNKHRTRNIRLKELEKLRGTLQVLNEKSKFLDEQKKSYHDYIASCMSQLGKKGKHKKATPFSRQYYHLRQLNKQGKLPQYGSFKYSASELLKKGVLISIEGYDPKQYGQITMTISSDEAGVFNVEAAFLGVTMPDKVELRLEDLLTAQDNNETVLTLFDGARVNLNLLIFLINKKFFG